MRVLVIVARYAKSHPPFFASLIGLKGPPGADERSARPYVLAHLLIILLLEPLVDGLEDSPRWDERVLLAA